MNGLSYCPSCKIQEYKELTNQPKPVESKPEEVVEEGIQEPIMPKPEEVKVKKYDYSKRWDITIYYLFISFGIILYLFYYSHLQKYIFFIFSSNKSVAGLLRWFILISVYIAYALYVHKYLRRTYLRFVYWLISLGIYYRMSILMIFTSYMERDSTGYAFLFILLDPVACFLLYIPVVLIRKALKRQ